MGSPAREGRGLEDMRVGPEGHGAGQGPRVHTAAFSRPPAASHSGLWSRELCGLSLSFGVLVIDFLKSQPTRRSDSTAPV